MQRLSSVFLAEGANLADAERAVKELDKQSCTVPDLRFQLLYGSVWLGGFFSLLPVLLPVIRPAQTCHRHDEVDFRCYSGYS